MAWLPSLVTLILGILSQSGADKWIATNPKAAGGLMALYALLKGLLPSPMTDTAPPTTPNAKQNSPLRSFAFAVVTLSMIAAPAHAFDVTVTGAQVHLSYQEPTTNKTATPLTDLGKTTGYYSAPITAPAQSCVTTPSMAPTGGGMIDALCIVPVQVDQEIDVRFFVTATDKSGNESDHSGPVDLRLDFLAPAAPR